MADTETEVLEHGSVLKNTKNIIEEIKVCEWSSLNELERSRETQNEEKVCGGIKARVGDTIDGW